MKENLNIYYDEEGDFLEINIGKITKGSFREIADGIAERIDEKTGKITGISILSFKKRIKKEKGLNISLPFKIKLIEKL
ncbi:DUF2283 domain-containing protein [Candidatus Woesearchaeota archaeon]|nr:DUF2283 domain-containing protein [Candidatus Woesearchaeota archaeon]